MKELHFKWSAFMLFLGQRINYRKAKLLKSAAVQWILLLWSDYTKKLRWRHMWDLWNNRGGISRWWQRKKLLQQPECKYHKNVLCLGHIIVVISVDEFPRRSERNAHFVIRSNCWYYECKAITIVISHYIADTLVTTVSSVVLIVNSMDN